MSFLFKVSKIYENKLSEQIKTDSWAKRKLIEMETLTQKSPIYSFLSIGLFAYVWIFLFMLIYNQAYGYEMAILVVVFTTVCFFNMFLETYLTMPNVKHNRNSKIVLIITLIISVIIAITDKGKLPSEYLESIFFFFIEINKKSYIALSILAFFSLGITISYYRCPYEVYRIFYSENKAYVSEKPLEKVINVLCFFSILLILFSVYMVYVSFNSCNDSYRFLFKSISMIYFLLLPPFVITPFIAKKYLVTFNLAQKFDK